ncbi:hypothetical protein XENTR_v10019386 [Xenopus tropicalis]|nr:hypothetical protein XENTR_v10019386 [Xenopus tropicalis]
MVEMEEERLRMREHVMKNVDANHDRLVTLDEFLKSTERKEFNEADGWEAVMQMEQKKAQQTGAEAAAGPNGELKFQPEAPHAESEHGKSRQTDICSDRT